MIPFPCLGSLTGKDSRHIPKPILSLHSHSRFHFHGFLPNSLGLGLWRAAFRAACAAVTCPPATSSRPNPSQTANLRLGSFRLLSQIQTKTTNHEPMSASGLSGLRRFSQWRGWVGLADSLSRTHSTILTGKVHFVLYFRAFGDSGKWCFKDRLICVSNGISNALQWSR